MPKPSPLESRLSAALLSQNIQPTPQLLAALAQAAKPPKEPSALDKMTEAILTVCKWTSAMWGRAARTAKKLLALGLTAADILLHYGPTDPGAGVWWWWRKGTDWRNKSLTDALIAETCGMWDAQPVGSRAVAVLGESQPNPWENMLIPFSQQRAGSHGD